MLSSVLTVMGKGRERIDMPRSLMPCSKTGALHQDLGIHNQGGVFKMTGLQGPDGTNLFSEGEMFLGL